MKKPGENENLRNYPLEAIRTKALLNSQGCEINANLGNR